MFTGLVEQQGTLVRHGANKLAIRPERPWHDLHYGESIAVNGCCLTLERESEGVLEFHTLAETLRRTNLGLLPVGSPLNLERALALDARLGGHIVQGHVDCIGKILSLSRHADGDTMLSLSFPPEESELVVAKGSLAVDGVSLTVVEAETGRCAIRLIPVTLKETALGKRKAGMAVNLEFDILGRYVRRHFQCAEPEGKSSSSGITMEKLRQAGFLS